MKNKYGFLQKIKCSFNKFLSKILNKKTAKAVLCICSIAFLVFAPSFIFNKSNYKINMNEYLNLTSKEKIVLNLWHIETFEGGTNSRKMYLENQAIKFNKQNNNCFVSVKTLTEEQLFLNLQSGASADIYSFGIGAGYMLPSLLMELPKNNNVRKDLQEYANLNNNIYAYPYILSGYALISHNSLVNETNSILELLQSKTMNKKTVAGVCFANETSINPSQVLVENNIKDINKQNYLQCTTTYNAYTNFLSKKAVSLLGTARDVARIKNRELNGSISSCSYNFLGGYSDLIQYVGISKNLTKQQVMYATNFANFLTSSPCQTALKNYGLFSISANKIYEEDYMSNFEDALIKPLKSTNVFSNLQAIENQKNASFNILFK